MITRRESGVKRGVFEEKFQGETNQVERDKLMTEDKEEKIAGTISLSPRKRVEGLALDN